MKKILIIHTNGMGDFIMFTPALKLLKEKFPDAQIDILITNKNIKKFLEDQKIFDNIYVTDLNILSLLKALLNLRKKYDLSFFTVGGKIWKAKIFSCILKSKYMIGEVNSKKELLKFPYNKIIEKDENLHFVEANIKLVELIIGDQNLRNIKPEIKLKSESQRNIESFIIEKKIDNKIIFGIHPGCQKAYASRRWPEKYFVDVINNLEDIPQIKCIVFLGPEDKEVGDYLKKNTKAIFFENQNLNDVIALISKCKYFFNSDSGLGHIFTCFNEEIFSIFGPNQLGENQELRTGPYSKKRTILKIKNENKEYYLKKNEDGVYQCLIDLKPEIVIKKIKEKIQ